MTRLKSRTQCPPNGFQYRQAETGWYLNTWDFNQLCTELQKHRRANPRYKLSLDMKAIADEVDQANAIRVLGMKGGQHYVTAEGGAVVASLPKAIFPRRLPVLSAAERLVNGKDALLAWLGEGGKPVEKEEAERRAKICSVCPKNGKAELSWFTKMASEAIRVALNIRNDMGLQTSVDDKLDCCQACLCPLRLKVHTPMKHILKHLTPEVKADLDPGCWILQ